MKNKTKKKTKRFRNLSNDIFILKYTWQCIPGYVVWEMIYGVIMGIWSASGTIFTKLFYDAISNSVPFSHAAAVVIGMVLFYIALQMWYQWYRNIYRLTRQQKLHYEMNTMLFRKAKTIDLACYDDPEYYNEFVWAMSQSDSQAIAFIESLSTLVTQAIGLTLTTTVIASVSPILAVVAVIASIAIITLRRLRINLDVKSAVELNEVNRKGSYYERIFNIPDYAKEVRISHISDVALDKYRENLTVVRKTTEKYNIKGLLIDIPMGIIWDTLQPIVYIILLYQIMVKGTVGIAGLAVAFNAFWSLLYNMQRLIDVFIKFPEHGLYIEKVREFLNYEPKVSSGEVPAPEFDSVTFKNVSFGYNAEAQVLKNINMTIHRGEKIAIVGYNGAGKSTFIKLLMHLYDPREGEIIFNGKDIGCYDTKSYQDRIGAVFQDFQIFALPVAENVICENYDETKKATVDRALEMATLDGKISELPNGIHTELTREFYEDGVNLSGGEAQKIAIARVFAHKYDLIIMDEPSSALDPMAEYALNEHIRKFAADKTVVFISHRLSTTRHVDRIYMFEDGRIIESGSHDELMAQDGKYAEMFRVQAEKYSE